MDQPLFLPGPFRGTNGALLPNKVECDALSLPDIEAIAATYARHRRFSEVAGVPRGGLRIADAFRPYCTPDGPRLMVDDAWTTGGSMRRHARHLGWDDDWIGFVIFAWFLPSPQVDAFWLAGSWVHQEPVR